MPKDYSYGVIPVYKQEGGVISVLIVAKTKQDGDKWWGFPKGHPENSDQSTRESALREFKEETGLTPIFLGDKEYADRYVVEKDRELYDKTVTYFVGMVDTTKVTIDKNELDEYKWVPSNLVDHFLTRDSTKAMFCLAEHEVETIGNQNKNSA